MSKTISTLLGFALLGGGVSACSGSGLSQALPSVSSLSAVEVPPLRVASAANAAAAKSPAAALRRADASSIAGPAVSSSAYASAVLANNPTAYYQLADTSSTLADSGSNHITGSYGSAVTRDVKAITSGASGATAFPGGSAYNPNGYAYTPKSNALQVAHPTLELWFSLNAPNSTSHDIPMLVYGTVGRDARYGVFLHGLGNGAQCLEIQYNNAGQSGLVTLSSGRFSVGETYHVVVSFDGTNISSYINGVLDTTSKYPGSIDYTTYFTDGLQIGGADQGASWGSASFPGTIAQAAVYGSPLTSAQVTAHFLAGQLVPMTTETPRDSDNFVDSIGINAHFADPGSLYGTQFGTVEKLLVASGIRHVRDGINYNNAAYPWQMTTLAGAGVHTSYETQLGMTESQIQQWPKIIGDSFEQYEAPNEQDDVGNANWLPECIAFQKNLYSWVKSDPQLAKYPVLGPAIVSMTDAEKLGNQSAYMDNGNIHDYFGVYNPGTIGWGSYFAPFGNYGSISFNMNVGKVIDGTKPVMATETGYGTVAGNPLTLDDYADLRYMTRLFFEQFNAGIVRSYSYELMDEGGWAPFANFGLITTALQPKPAYTGIKSIIGELADPGSNFTTTPLTYQLTGFLNNVTHTLLQKRNGHYVLAVWLEVPDWVTLDNAGGDIIVPSQTVKLTTAKQFASATITTMSNTGSMSSAPLSWNGTSATINVTDTVTLIDLNP